MSFPLRPLACYSQLRKNYLTFWDEDVFGTPCGKYGSTAQLFVARNTCLHPIRSDGGSAKCHLMLQCCSIMTGRLCRPRQGASCLPPPVSARRSCSRLLQCCRLPSHPRLQQRPPDTRVDCMCSELDMDTAPRTLDHTSQI